MSGGAQTITLSVDGRPLRATVHTSTRLSDLLRLNAGCGEGVCGACTVVVDGEALRGCLLLAVQADGAEILTVASLPTIEGAPAGASGLTPLQEAVRDAGALQCGWCTPGLLVGTAAFLKDRDQASKDDILQHLVGHLCRCTGSASSLAAIEATLAARRTEARS